MLNALFTFEFLVLICSLFLFIYISKHKLNKWFRYFSLAITIIIGLLIICTATNAVFRAHDHRSKCCEHSFHMMQGDHNCKKMHYYGHHSKCEKKYSEMKCKEKHTNEKDQQEQIKKAVDIDKNRANTETNDSNE